MSIGAILYDMDGTLLDTERLHRVAWVERGRAHGAQIGEEFFSRVTGRNLAAVMDELAKMYPEIDDVEAVYAEKEKWCRAWMDEHGVPVLPGVHYALGQFSSRGLRQCVCTSTSRDSAELTLARAGILQKLDALVCGDDVVRSKPDPQIFLCGAQKLGMPIERCAVVEDSPLGAEAGLRAGARVLLVPGLVRMPEELERRCTRVDSLWQLPEQIGWKEEGI